MKSWYQVDVESIFAELKTDLIKGLSDTEVMERQQQYGLNELVERGLKNPWKIVWEQLTGVMTIVLIIAAVISIFLGDPLEAVVIAAIVILNTILGFTQEYNAEKSMAALKKMAAPRVKVKRNNHIVEIASRELVPGDVVIIETGSAIPADGRIVESINLRIQESILTGESEPVEKTIQVIEGEHVGIGDRRNMAFSGTTATFGRGQMVITDTGMHTELGKIADMIQNVGQEATPLQKKMDQIGKVLAMVALVIVAVVFVLGLIRGEDLKIMFETAIGMAVAAVPEGLQAVVTIALAFSAQNMLKRHALIRKLPAVETLGSTTVICSDKTGTLTENRMTVTVMDTAGNTVDFKEQVQDFSPQVNGKEITNPVKIENINDALILISGALCNDSTIEPLEEGTGFTSVGDPTEGALVIAAVRTGLWKDELEKAMLRVNELPFDSDRKRMTTVHELNRDALPALLKEVPGLLESDFWRPVISITKGAVDGLMEVCTHVLVGGREVDLDNEWRKRIALGNENLAKSGTRVLGVAYRRCPSVDDCKKVEEKDLVFIGMFGMIDPARPEVKDAVATCKTAGIRPIMITGDHPLTAMHIAQELGIASENDLVTTGQQLSVMTDVELNESVRNTSVYARVSPEHKMRIVTALQGQNQIVAMTGDGVNDAPALKKADIGVAMGITGTDVSKEAGDMVLMDDNFATIVAAVEEGRRVYDNVRKFIKYALTSNTGEIMLMVVGPFLGLPLPLTPLQILWVNLVTDGLPGLALTQEKAEKDIMRRKPYAPNESVFSRGLGKDILWIGAVVAAVSLFAGLWAMNTGRLETWQTMVFLTITMAQMANVLALRSDKYSLFQIGIFSNKAMTSAVLGTFVLQLAVIYIPFFQPVFDTHPLPLPDLLFSLGLSLIVFIAIEVVKFFKRHREDARYDLNQAA